MIRLFQFASAVLVLAFIALLAAITTMHFAIHGAEVTIPDFRGMTDSGSDAQGGPAGSRISAWTIASIPRRCRWIAC